MFVDDNAKLSPASRDYRGTTEVPDGFMEESGSKAYRQFLWDLTEAEHALWAAGGSLR